MEPFSKRNSKFSEYLQVKFDSKRFYILIKISKLVSSSTLNVFSLNSAQPTLLSSIKRKRSSDCNLNIIPASTNQSLMRNFLCNFFDQLHFRHFFILLVSLQFLLVIDLMQLVLFSYVSVNIFAQ
jgi:hypothetical protein